MADEQDASSSEKTPASENIEIPPISKQLPERQPELC
jgi:hypothetical protein